MTDGCSDLQRDTDIAHGRLPVRGVNKISALPTDVPQCVADSLTDVFELDAWIRAHREGDDDPLDMPNIITRLCEVAEQKDKVHQLLVDRVNEFIAGEGNDDHE